MTEFLSGWLYEAGIGENRAALIDGGELVQVCLERHSDAVRTGAIIDAKFKQQWVAGRSGIIALDGGQEALLQPLPKGLTEGAIVRVEIVREAMAERGGQSKRAKARPVKDGVSFRKAPDLLERLEAGNHPVKLVHPHDDDLLSAFGWHEALEQAAAGLISFEGGNLLISLTPAMTVIDIDGTLPPVELAKRAAREIALAVGRLDITGSIGVDFPTLPNKADRTEVCAIFDEYMAGKCERTAINGFGLMQIVSRKVRQSVPEIVQSDSVLAAALNLLRQAQRDHGNGAMQLQVHPAVAAKLTNHSTWLEELSKRTGRAVDLAADGKIPIGGGTVAGQSRSS